MTRIMEMRTRSISPCISNLYSGPFLYFENLGSDVIPVF